MESKDKSYFDYEIERLKARAKPVEKDEEDTDCEYDLETPIQPFLYHSYRILDLCNAIKRLVEFPENKKVYIKVSKYAEEIAEIADMVGFVDE